MVGLTDLMGVKNVEGSTGVEEYSQKFSDFDSQNCDQNIFNKISRHLKDPKNHNLRISKNGKNPPCLVMPPKHVLTRFISH